MLLFPVTFSLQFPHTHRKGNCAVQCGAQGRAGEALPARGKTNPYLLEGSSSRAVAVVMVAWPALRGRMQDTSWASGWTGRMELQGSDTDGAYGSTGQDRLDVASRRVAAGPSYCTHSQQEEQRLSTLAISHWAKLISHLARAGRPRPALAVPRHAAPHRGDGPRSQGGAHYRGRGLVEHGPHSPQLDWVGTGGCLADRTCWLGCHDHGTGPQTLVDTPRVKPGTSLGRSSILPMAQEDRPPPTIVLISNSLSAPMRN